MNNMASAKMNAKPPDKVYTASDAYDIHGHGVHGHGDSNNSNVVEHKYIDHAHETGGDSFAKLSFLTIDNDHHHDNDRHHHHHHHDDNSARQTSSCAIKSSSSPSSSSRGITVPFPLKLHEMLDQIEKDGLASVISWQPHGRCFVVHDQKRFAADAVMAKYFRQTKFASFQRQLNLYGFNRLTSGRDKGGYYNDLFLRGKRFLCHRIQRIRIKGTGVRKASSPETEPQFYSMAPVGVGGEDGDHATQGVAIPHQHQQQHAQGSSSTRATQATTQAPTPVLTVSMGGYPQQHWNEQMATNQVMLNNQGYSGSMQVHHTNPLAALSSNASAYSNTTIQDIQRMILEQQAKLTLAQTAIRQAASVFPDTMHTANAAQTLELLQSMAQPNHQEMGDVASQIATMIRQKLREQQIAERKQQLAEQKQKQFESNDDDDDESQKEFDQLLGALVGMPTEPTPTCTNNTNAAASNNPLASNTSLANLYEMITD
jgi:hypothetical protein